MIGKEIKNTEKKMRQSNIFGFESIGDFIISFFGIKWKFVNIIPAFLLGIGGFVGGYIYESVETVYILWILMGLDWFTGIAKSIKSKTFVSYKIMRMPIYFLATTMILSLGWWMSKQSFIFIPLPGIIIGGLYSVYFISMLENLGELEWLPKPIIKVLKNKFGLKSVIDKFDNNEKNPS